MAQRWAKAFSRLKRWLNCRDAYIKDSIMTAICLLANEIISILENILDIGVEMPPFLLPLVKNVRLTVEERADMGTKEDGDEE